MATWIEVRTWAARVSSRDMSKEVTDPVLITFSTIREYIKEEPDQSSSCSDDDEMMEGDGLFKSHLVLGEMGRDSTKLTTSVNFNKELRFEACNSKQINDDDEEEAVEEDAAHDSDVKRKKRGSYYVTRSNPKQTHEPSFKLKVDHEVQEIRKCRSCRGGGAPQSDLCDPVKTGQSDLCDPVETSQGDICDPVETGQGDICDPVEMGRHKCSVCDKQFSIKKHLIDHYPTHIEPEYRCVVCSEWFFEKNMLVHHYNTHIEPPGFNCKDCGLSFATRSELLGHFPLTKEKVKFKCLECGTSLLSKRFLLIHYNSHITPDKPGCKCGKCKRCSRRAKHLGTTHEYRCEKCDVCFETKFMLLNHRQKQHQRNTCRLCGRRFKKRASLLKHYSIHYKQKVECEECGKVFVSSTFLKYRHPDHQTKHDKQTNTSFLQQVIKEIEHDRHKPISKNGKSDNLPKLTQSSSNKSTLDELEGRPPPSDDNASKEGNYSHMVMSGDASIANIMEPKIEILEKCEDCDKLFKTKENLTAHRLVHNKQYNCSKCGKSFLFKDSLADHACTRNKTERHKCEECDCGQCFADGLSLNQHRLFHCSEKPYRCEYCGKCFKSNSSICQHRLTHSENKKYMCEECGKRFKILAALNQHRLTHRGYRPHTCEECGKGFALRSQLSRHWLVHAKHKT
uniref:C2H2-type domain-containing protein n=1 Tax=Timema monikensis TaxID=170555 RepID=A0A7R9E8U6_9NEOP|nr:unnamed protein product [Timema monikensis]